jgi:hypothetical protein
MERAKRKAKAVFTEGHDDGASREQRGKFSEYFTVIFRIFILYFRHW